MNQIRTILLSLSLLKVYFKTGPDLYFGNIVHPGDLYYEKKKGPSSNPDLLLLNLSKVSYHYFY